MGEYMHHRADYRIASDAQLKESALGDQYVKDGIALVNENVRAGRACPDVMAAHDQLETARDLMEHRAVGAAGDLSTAEAAWAVAFQAATG